jgi:epoxyqueuosine reductase
VLKVSSAKETGLTYQCNHCVCVCPAGETIRSEYETDKRSYFNTVVKPLIERRQSVYVIEGSEAEKKTRTNPSKKVKTVNPLL